MNRRRNQPPPPAYISRGQLARYLSCSPATVRRLERRGVIHAVMVGNYPRYAISELARTWPGLKTHTPN